MDFCEGVCGFWSYKDLREKGRNSCSETKCWYPVGICKHSSEEGLSIRGKNTILIHQVCSRKTFKIHSSSLYHLESTETTDSLFVEKFEVTPQALFQGFCCSLKRDMFTLFKVHWAAWLSNSPLYAWLTFWITSIKQISAHGMQILFKKANYKLSLSSHFSRGVARCIPEVPPLFPHVCFPACLFTCLDVIDQYYSDCKQTTLETTSHSKRFHNVVHSPGILHE